MPKKIAVANRGGLGPKERLKPQFVAVSIKKKLEVWATEPPA